MNKTQIKAILQAVAKNNVRYFLNGLHVDFDKKELIATDGHAIVIVENVQGLEGTGRVIIPRNIVELVSKIKTSHELKITPTHIGYVSERPLPFNPIESGYKLDYWKVVPSGNAASERFGFYRSEYIKLLENVEAAFKTQFVLHCPEDVRTTPLKGVLESDNGERVTICFMPYQREVANQ